MYVYSATAKLVRKINNCYICLDCFLYKTTIQAAVQSRTTQRHQQTTIPVALNLFKYTHMYSELLHRAKHKLKK